MRIAYIGLGTMGGPMVTNLLEAGHELAVYDVRCDLADPHLESDARWADSPAVAARGAELILTSLTGPREVELVALGDRGIVHGAERDAVYADLSTSSPTLIRRIHGTFAERGVHVLDAPVSGGPPGAQQGFGQGMLLSLRMEPVVFRNDFDQPRITLKLARKDVGLAAELADELDVSLPVATLTEQLEVEGPVRGYGDKDYSSFFLLQEACAGVEVRHP